MSSKRWAALVWRLNEAGDLVGFSGITALLVKTSGLEEQAMLIEADPDLYYRPPYLGPYGWIGIRLDTEEPDWEHVNDWLVKSWRLSAPRKLADVF